MIKTGLEEKIMKKLFLFGMVVAFVLGTMPALAFASDTQNYGNIQLSGGFMSGHFSEVWDLNACDMIISFTYDANGLVDDLGGDGAHAWAELGIRKVGNGDFNPNGAGVWLATDYDWSVNTFDLDPAGAPKLDLDDKLILQRVSGQGEGSYNLPSTPTTPGANHRFWWDRDGVDPWQNGATANTKGIYNIEIRLHAKDLTSGKAYMTINGRDQGFETDGNWNTIELTPAGMTFTGDMAKMQVFYGLYGYGATHSVAFENITVDGCRSNVFIGDCDTGVQDQVYNGKLISDWIGDCAAADVKNHGNFVSCVAELTNELKKVGVITGKDKGAIQSCAAQADIP